MKAASLGLIVIGTALAGCKQRSYNNSETSSIEGPGKGEMIWKRLASQDEVLRYQEAATFATINPGYSLSSRGLYITTVDDGNIVVEKLLKVELAITKGDREKIVTASVITTEKNLGPCASSVNSASDNKSNDLFTCRGVFFKDTLVGAVGCNFNESPFGICVDKDIGKQLCTKDKRSYTIVGCQIPHFDVNKVPSEVIVLKP